ncbi:MAG: hypothetical protein KBT05_02635 [Bacteroidales bacterium]|nr:hypothetical protein [Candidatus Cryptobacteroides caccocaballi]
MFKISKTIKAAAMVAACLVSFSCNKEVVTELKLSDSVANFDAAASSKNITVKSNVDWTATSDAAWLTVTKTDGTLSLSASANDSFDSRNATVTVKAKELTETVKVTQLGMAPAIAVSPETVEVDAGCGSYKVQVTSNAEWEYTFDEEACDWIAITLDKELEGYNANLWIDVNENFYLEARSVVITVTEKKGGNSKTITVSQAASAPSHFTDSLALVAMYNASNGAKWAKDNWDLTKPINEWPKVTVNEAGRVTKINLGTKTITEGAWEIPAEIGTLTELTELVLGTNMVTGEFPEFLYELKNIVKLNLPTNTISGSFSSKIANWTKLDEFSLLNNVDFGGAIPAEIGECESLRLLNLNGTSVSGAIPVELAKCQKLQFFMCFKTKLSGELPDIWDKFPDLRTIQLYQCEGLTGNLPESLGRLKSTFTTVSLQMYGCNFTGNIPESFSELPAGAKQLRLQGNKLSGVIPAAVQAHANWTKWEPEKYLFPQQEGYGLTIE